VDRLAEYAPGIGEAIVGHQVLTPFDLESIYGVSGGHLFHGEHATDQLVVRPTPECTGYRTPFEGLFLCGSGSHPGGGITCAPGALAARTILRR
jgi:phytoene dehydrogenase-like protein